MAASKQVPVNFVGGWMPIVVPAAFYEENGTMDRASLTEAGCCRSGLSNVSATKECSESEASACCEKGKAEVIPAAAVEAGAACDKGAACCKNQKTPATE